MTTTNQKARLEYLRGEIRAERISQGELIQLADLAEHIEPGDVELLEWANVPEFAEAWYVVLERCTYDQQTLPDLVVGPYTTEQEAETEGQSDTGIVYALVTSDAKDNYICDNVYWTTDPPANSERITPDKETA